jgi:mycobactin peptide synthetase MbtE
MSKAVTPISRLSPPDPYVDGDRIERLVARQARKHPDAIALQQGRTTLTYREVAEGACSVAAALAERGVSPGSFVPTLMARAPALVIALLGIMRTGAAYIALDGRWPVDRIMDVVQRTRAPLVLTDGEAGYRMGVQFIPYDRLGSDSSQGSDERPDLRGDETACVFFTSGSTGRPKGVMSPHRGAIRAVVNNPLIPVDRDAVFLQAAPLPWDACSLEIWAPLLNGGRCLLIDPGRHAPDIHALRRAFADGLNSLWLTSSLFNIFADVDPGIFEDLRMLMIGAERVSVPHVRRVRLRHPSLHFLNGYGPVENTIFSTAHLIQVEDVSEDAEEIPIGVPLPRTVVAVLDSDKRPAARGEIGEIVVGGDGLALGYLGDVEETHRRFFRARESGLEPGRYYRTGDLGTVDDDGNLRFRGRADRQFKLHGLRIEPGEVEAALEAHPSISSCCVVRVEHAPGQPKLACVYTTTDSVPLTNSEIRLAASRRLPRPMIPRLIRHVRQLPLQANGKIDLSSVHDLILEGEAVAPSRAVVSDYGVLLDELRDLLELPDIRIDDDLFEKGATLVDVIPLAERLSARLDALVTVKDIYEARTVAALLSNHRPQSDQLH